MSLMLLVAGTFLTVLGGRPDLSGALPARIDPEASYVFYAHGFIVEGADPRPVHPQWGVYDFPAIVEALGADGTMVMARHREEGAEPHAEAARLAAQVNNLLDAGVPAERIALVGFSRGRRIVALAADLVGRDDVTSIVLAGCWDWVEREPQVRPRGRVRSIVETSDTGGSCEALAGRGGPSSFEERVISTGLGHGAFYRPRAEWLDPVRDWIAD